MSAQSISVKQYIDTERLVQWLPTCDLWIQLGASRISLLAADRFNARVAGLSILDFPNKGVFESSWTQLQSWLQQSALFAHEYQNIHLVFSHPYHTLVPQVLYESSQSSAMLKLVHEVPKSWNILSRPISNKPWVSVFAIPEQLANPLQQRFPQSAPEHSIAALLNGLQLHNGKNQHRLYANIEPEYMHIIHFTGSDLQFSNTFIPEAETDIVYFLLSVAEQQNIHADKLEVCLLGDVNTRSSMVALLRKYIPHVSFFERNETIHFPASFKEFPDHQYIEALSVLWSE